MKKQLLVFLLLVAWTALQAQDKIITIQQDTIHCRIVSVNAERISYELKTADNQYVGKSILTTAVAEYLRTGGPVGFGAQDRIKIRPVPPKHRWLFSLQGGLAYSFNNYDDFENILRTEGNPSSMVDDYFSKLKNGYHLNAGFHYLLKASLGLGLDYNLFYAASKGEFTYRSYGVANVPIYLTAHLDEKIYTHYAGLSLLFQQFAGKQKKIRISQTISPGMVMFRNESRNLAYGPHGDYGYGGYGGYGGSYYSQANSLTTATTFGAKGSLAIDYAFAPHLSAGLAGQFMWAEIHKASFNQSGYKTRNEDLESPIDLSHIDYGVVVRYNF